jgi:hypothetical protein
MVKAEIRRMWKKVSGFCFDTFTAINDLFYLETLTAFFEKNVVFINDCENKLFLVQV